MIVEYGECSQNMLSEAFWIPNIASPNTSNQVREQTFAQLRAGVRLPVGERGATLAGNRYVLSVTVINIVVIPRRLLRLRLHDDNSAINNATATTTFVSKDNTTGYSYHLSM